MRKSSSSPSRCPRSPLAWTPRTKRFVVVHGTARFVGLLPTLTALTAHTARAHRSRYVQEKHIREAIKRSLNAQANPSDYAIPTPTFKIVEEPEEPPFERKTSYIHFHGTHTPHTRICRHTTHTTRTRTRTHNACKAHNVLITCAHSSHAR